jgi:hypothetical protein
MSTTDFYCDCCYHVSTGPFKIGPVEVAPACRNDDCATQWWNRISDKPLFEQIKDIVRIHAGVEV